MARGKFGGGNGTELNPYLVEDAQDLNAVRNKLTAHYKQVKNIDLSTFENWLPIYDYSNYLGFSGTYDGRGYRINKLTIKRADVDYLGLFGYCENATFKNINVTNADISATTGSTASQQAGILAAIVSGCMIADCAVKGKILLNQNGNCSAGGLIAVISGACDIQRCSATDVTISATNVGLFCFTYIGDLVKDCYAQGSLIGYNNTYYGTSAISGFACFHYYGEIKNCYANAKMSYNHVDNLYDAPRTTVFSPTENPSFLENCYADIENYGVTEWENSKFYYTDTRVKGTDGRIYNCIQNQPDLIYPEGDSSSAQPITGYNWAQFYALDNSNVYKNTSQMKTKSNYVGWDFENVWKFTEGKYPTLRKRSTGQLEAMPLTSITVVG